MNPEEALPEKDAEPGHRKPWVVDIPRAPMIGKRGAVWTPVGIEWRPSGYGLGTRIWRTCGCVVLMPHVRYINARGEKRLVAAQEWVRLASRGSVKIFPTASDGYTTFQSQLRACALKKEAARKNNRMGDIVMSILQNGGTLKIKESGIDLRVG